jgi:hypothetical protein
VRSYARRPARGRSLKAQQRATYNIEVNVVLGDPLDRTTEVIDGAEAPGDELQIP